MTGEKRTKTKNKETILERHANPECVRVVDRDSAMRFLSINGYKLVEPASKRAARKAEVEAIKVFQSFNSLRVTGRLNEDTRSVMNQPQCPLPDLPTFAVVSKPWQKSNVKYFFGSLASQHLSSSTIKATIRKAFVTWNDSTAAPSFSEVGQIGSADIVIEWIGGLNDPCSSLTFDETPAHSGYPPGNFLPANPPIKIHFSDAHRWTVTGDPNAYDLETVALHEIGHCVGLFHSPVSGAVMNVSRGLGLVRRTLHNDDIAGANELYA